MGIFLNNRKSHFGIHTFKFMISPTTLHTRWFFRGAPILSIPSTFTSARPLSISLLNVVCCSLLFRCAHSSTNTTQAIARCATERDRDDRGQEHERAMRRHFDFFTFRVCVMEAAVLDGIQRTWRRFRDEHLPCSSSYAHDCLVC